MSDSDNELFDEIVDFLDSTDDEIEDPEKQKTGFKISAHGGFIFKDMLDVGFKDYINNKKTFTLKVRSEIGGTTLTKQCSRQIEETCEGTKCVSILGDTENYINYLQIVCGKNDEGEVGLFSTLLYNPKGEICNSFNDKDLVPDLQLSSTKDDSFYYGYTIYYNNDDGREKRRRDLHRFNNFNNYKEEEEITYLSIEIINFYNLVKDSPNKNFDVKVATCLVLADRDLKISCMQKYKKVKADDEIPFAGWFNCFQNIFNYQCDDLYTLLGINIITLEDADKYYNDGLLTDEEYQDYQLKFLEKADAKKGQKRVRVDDLERQSSRQKYGRGKEKRQTKKRKPFKKKQTKKRKPLKKKKKKKQTKKRKSSKKKKSKSKSK